MCADQGQAVQAHSWQMACAAEGARERCHPQGGDKLDARKSEVSLASNGFVQRSVIPSCLPTERNPVRTRDLSWNPMQSSVFCKLSFAIECVSSDS